MLRPNGMKSQRWQKNTRDLQKQNLKNEMQEKNQCGKFGRDLRERFGKYASVLNFDENIFQTIVETLLYNFFLYDIISLYTIFKY